MTPTDHVRRMFAAFDAKDVSALVGCVTDDVRLRLGNAEPVQGKSEFDVHACVLLMRGLQGLGGALLAPAVLSIITTTFSDAKDRAKALAIWSAIAAGGGAVGLLLGGVLTDLASWRWIFFVNVPVAVALAVATVSFVPESRSELSPRTFDLPGAVSVTAGLVVLVFAIVKSQSYGWGSPRTIGLLAAGVALLAGFSRSSVAAPRR